MVAPRRFVALSVVVAACGGPTAAPKPPSTPAPPPATSAAPSLAQIERLARACVLIPDGVELHTTATWEAGTWSAEARVGDRKLALDPVASTCDGARFAVPAEASELSLDEVVAVARQCDEDEAQTISVAYLFTTRLDRSKLIVMFTPAGGARIFPMPMFVVDPAAKTCGPPPGMQF